MSRRFASTCVTITEQSQVGEARRAAQTMALAIGLGETEVGQAGIIATEAATNIILHAGSGRVLIQPCADMLGIELLAIDRGPGMPDLTRCLEDGYSTSGTAGQGLGAIRRQSSTFDIYSQRSKGTVVLATVKPRSSAKATPSMETGAVCVGKHGEDVCGDLWSLHYDGPGCAIVVADGLGHGLGAAEAAQRAVEIFDDDKNCLPGDCLGRIHDGLRATRGAAAAVARVDRSKGIIRYAGIGNIAASVMNGQPARSLISYNGILGHGVHKLQELNYPWSEGAILVMHSDGLSTHWDLDSYPGLRNRHPSVIAAVLFRDHARERDDVTVVVTREVRA